MKIEDLEINKKYLDGRYEILKEKEKLIVFLDFSNLSDKNYKEFFSKLSKWNDSLELEPNSVLNLINVSKNKLNKEILETLKDMSMKYSKPFSKKTAIIGISRWQKIFVDAINKLINIDIKIFDTKEEAINWLIE